MLISLGGGAVLRDNEIVAIFDHLTLSEAVDPAFFEAFRQAGRFYDQYCQRVSSYVLAIVDGQERLYASPHDAAQLRSDL